MKGSAPILLACACLLQAASSEEWWPNANFYQIYPRSFQDSDADGVGDLNGITQRLEYVKYLGIHAVWLSPIFKSPMKDFGYDISDYRDIHHEFGTMADFERLLKRCSELGIKLLLDFVPNHSSDQHAWFVASSDPSHADHAKYKDFYVWHKGGTLANGTRVPPSNWRSIFRFSAWTFHEKRQEYYLHQFLPAQPDLNYRSAALVAEMKDTLRFWLDKGVDGFRIDAVPYLYEIEVNSATNMYDDEPHSNNPSCGPDDHCYLNHPYTSDLDETFEMIYQWREITDSYTDKVRVLMTEAYTSFENTLRFYGGTMNNKLVNGSQVPFNFELIGKTYRGSSAADYLTQITNWVNSMPKRDGIYANWVLGNHDNKRISTRYNPPRTDLINILLKTLPGISVSYYGEELGMTDVHISWEDTQDPQACNTNSSVYENVSRDPARTPMQWDASLNAGFSTAEKTWLPVAANYTTNNVAVQDGQVRSHLKVFKSLLTLKKHPTMHYGQLSMTTFGPNVLVYKRQQLNDPSADIFFIVLNLGSAKVQVPLSTIMQSVPDKLEVILSSVHSKSLVIGDTVNSNLIEIDGDVGVIFANKAQQL